MALLLADEEEKVMSVLAWDKALASLLFTSNIGISFQERKSISPAAYRGSA
jgi:hypothetical protein